MEPQKILIVALHPFSKVLPTKMQFEPEKRGQSTALSLPSLSLLKVGKRINFKLVISKVVLMPSLHPAVLKGAKTRYDQIL